MEVQNAICRAEEVKDMQRAALTPPFTLHMTHWKSFLTISIHFISAFFFHLSMESFSFAEAMKARRLFKSMDDDETGQISYNEILNHTKELQRASES